MIQRRQFLDSARMMAPQTILMAILPTLVVSANNEGENRKEMDRSTFFIAFFLCAVPFTFLGLTLFYSHTLQVLARWKFRSILKQEGEIVSATVENSSQNEIETKAGIRKAFMLLVNYETKQLLAEKNNANPLSINTKIKVTSKEFQLATQSGSVEVVVYPGYPEYAVTKNDLLEPKQLNLESTCAMILSLVLPFPFSITGMVALSNCYDETDALQKVFVVIFSAAALCTFVVITIGVLFHDFPSSVMKDHFSRSKSARWFSPQMSASNAMA